jgi:small-conductance mechanosensitive channel
MPKRTRKQNRPTSVRRTSDKQRNPQLQAYQRQIKALEAQLDKAQHTTISKASTEDLMAEVRARVEQALEKAENRANNLNELVDALDGDFSHIEELD